MIIAGVDEVGRGPLAGPVVAAAVIMNQSIQGVTDSKKLTPKRRSELALMIQASALCFAYGRAEVEEIGLHTPHVAIPCQAIVQGDNLVEAIGAASILAKVARDEEMIALDQIYPGYGFAQHKGYPTSAHRAQLVRLGACDIHRKSFAPVAAVLLNRTACLDDVIA